MIEHAVMGVFDDFDKAEQARAALLADGFDADAVELKVHNDEAGPVEGNFYVGNTPSESEQHVYDRNYTPVQRAQCMLVVDADDAAMAARVGGILAGFGARDPDRLSAAGVGGAAGAGGAAVTGGAAGAGGAVPDGRLRG